LIITIITIFSGHEVGPLEALLVVRAINLTKNKVVRERLQDNESEKQKSSFCPGASVTSVWEESYLMKKKTVCSLLSLFFSWLLAVFMMYIVRVSKQVLILKYVASFYELGITFIK